jgi:glycosyltransferase involved in cell wall biosynthesis
MSHPSSLKLLRICHIITRLDLGGSAENTILTAIGLRQQGHAVDLVCGVSENPPSRSETEAQAIGIRCIRLSTLARPVSPVRDTIALVTLIRLLRKNRYDIVHTHTSKAGIIGRIAALLARTPLVVHTPHGHIFYGYFSSLLTRCFTLLERIVTQWTDALITLTVQEKRDYLDRRIGSPGRMFPILSGIDLSPYRSLRSDRERMRSSIGLERSAFVAGTVARLVPVKNHDLIVSAAFLLRERCPDVKFLFIGDGELRQPLESRVQSLGLDSFFMFLGWRNDIPECLSMLDLFVMCSLNEGMGRAFIEAQACGVPVIGSRVGGVVEAIAEGTTGFLVDPADHEELAEKIALLHNDRTLLAHMAAACRPHVDPAFGKEVMVEKIGLLYRRLHDKRTSV